MVAGRGDLAAHKQPFAHAHEPVTDFAAAVRTPKPTGIVGVAEVAHAQGHADIARPGDPGAHMRDAMYAPSNPVHA